MCMKNRQTSLPNVSCGKQSNVSIAVDNLVLKINVFVFVFTFLLVFLFSSLYGMICLVNAAG